MSWYQVQASRLIGVYCALLVLGVFLEVHQPVYLEPSDGQKFKHRSLQAKQTKIRKEFKVIRNKTTYPNKIFKSKIVESSNGISSDKVQFSSKGQNDVILQYLFDMKGYATNDRGPMYALDAQSAMNNQEKSKKERSLTLSSELNAFDEIVTLLTVSATYCAELDSMKLIVSDSSYHCAVKTFSKCHHGNLRANYYTYRSSRKCSKSRKIAGYGINPANPVHLITKESHSIVGNNKIESKVEIFEKTEKRKITVDVTHSFVNELKSMIYMPAMRLDFEFDLVGLNSLHKYEVISKLLKILRLVLKDKGYHLERSSADSHRLQDYLHQEGLHQPLRILTLWQRHL